MTQAEPPMNLLRLWWTAVVRPGRAFAEVGRRPAPLWAFTVILAFNLLISLTTTLGRVLGGGEVLLPSWLTFLPDDRYLLAELFFLPAVRMATWLLGAAVVYLGARLAGRPADMDRLLQVGGVVYLVVMPYTFAVDWTTLAFGAFGMGLIVYVHGVVDLVWSVALQVVGLRVLLGLPAGLALGLTLLSTLFTLPLLMIFAR
ncbi:YIP1 family protein [Calidithermus chliarophilus]|uniref:YIP1 family protein n=1 Tax=Calidithermus chliarophilus TaxID=52023 RepID=UPI0004164520|nr:YIP1 family protein [Calidithermus chliarophilus]